MYTERKIYDIYGTLCGTLSLERVVWLSMCSVLCLLLRTYHTIGMGTTVDRVWSLIRDKKCMCMYVLYSITYIYFCMYIHIYLRNLITFSKGPSYNFLLTVNYHKIVMGRGNETRLVSWRLSSSFLSCLRNMGMSCTIYIYVVMSSVFSVFIPILVYIFPAL